MPTGRSQMRLEVEEGGDLGDPLGDLGVLAAGAGQAERLAERGRRGGRWTRPVAMLASTLRPREEREVLEGARDAERREPAASGTRAKRSPPIRMLPASGR